MHNVPSDQNDRIRVDDVSLDISPGAVYIANANPRRVQVQEDAFSDEFSGDDSFGGAFSDAFSGDSKEFSGDYSLGSISRQAQRRVDLRKDFEHSARMSMSVAADTAEDHHRVGLWRSFIHSLGLKFLIGFGLMR